MENLQKDLINYLENATRSVQEILFVPTTVHPVWEDNAEILTLANQQILQPAGILPNEEILAFIGMHAQTIFTGTRDSVGFLITNLRVLIQTDYSVIGKAETAQSTSFTKRQNVDDIVPSIWEDFIKKNQLSIPGEQLSGMQTALKNVLDLVLPSLQQLSSLPDEILKSTNVNDRIRDLGLQPALKSYAQDEKKLKKFAEKYNLSNIQFGIVDKPFFGGVYGLVITKEGIVSRDSMEDSFASSWQEIRNEPAKIGEKNDVILAGGKRHVIPTFQTESASNLIILINELANGEVSLEFKNQIE
ncbi:hypothetical protein [Epilithonimonas lactis]|uniref:Uncharacterized protein n=1 Tax=Epilithonimonas lactis TaxID=421072 RepID=A0A085BHU7_9FLAO|nr:hypothetical protein [Epilithonimonas lactis]KFC22042.1 hypothetical protein IO89_08755 [Epilithonimonas lactis]SEQ52676.1 hypothetical protein SAMN04488097_2365 [Epilithonimonas lactis]